MTNTCKQQRFTVNAVHVLYQLAKSHIMPGTNRLNAGYNTSQKHIPISIFKIPKAKFGMPEHKNGKKNI